MNGSLINQERNQNMSKALKKWNKNTAKHMEHTKSSSMKEFFASSVYVKKLEKKHK